MLAIFMSFKRIDKQFTLQIFKLLRKHLYMVLVFSVLPLPFFVWAYAGKQVNSFGDSVGDLIGSLVMTFGELLFYFAVAGLFCLLLSIILLRRAMKFKNSLRTFMVFLLVESIMILGVYSLPLLSTVDNPSYIFFPVILITNTIILYKQNGLFLVIKNSISTSSYDSEQIRGRLIMLGFGMFTGMVGYIYLFYSTLRLSVWTAYQFLIGSLTS